jgi:hypothetical protein
MKDETLNLTVHLRWVEIPEAEFLNTHTVLMIGDLKVARYYIHDRGTYRCDCILLNKARIVREVPTAIVTCEAWAQQVIDLMQVKP